MHQHFIKRNVILWPARFMIGKGFTLPASRYEAIMRSIFQTIIQHGDTGVVKFWPGYPEAIVMRRVCVKGDRKVTEWWLWLQISHNGNTTRRIWHLPIRMRLYINHLRLYSRMS